MIHGQVDIIKNYFIIIILFVIHESKDQYCEQTIQTVIQLKKHEFVLFLLLFPWCHPLSASVLMKGLQKMLTLISFFSFTQQLNYRKRKLYKMATRAPGGLIREKKSFCIDQFENNISQIWPIRGINNYRAQSEE